MLQINLLGKLSVHRNTDDDVALPLKAQELLGFLLLFPKHAHLREVLAAHLWGESNAAQAKKYFRQTLWHLQSLLSQEPETHEEPLLLVDGDWVQVNTNASLWVDTWLLQKAFHTCKDCAGEKLADEQAEWLKDIVTRCHGELLPNWYYDWCLLERERYRSMLFVLLDKLVAYCIAHEQWESGIQYGMMLLQMDQSREKGHRHLMQLYYLSGDRTAALRQYHYCQRLLQAEFAVEPTEKTQQLWRFILNDQGEAIRGYSQSLASSSAGQPVPEVNSSAHLLQQIMVELGRLRSDMNDMRQILAR